MLKCVSPMEMDTELQTEQLEAALANLSDPSFVLWKKKEFVIRWVCVDSRKMLACCILYSNHYVSLYYFTFQVYSLKIFQLMLELLVDSTPPSYITAAIVDFVQKIATYIVIKELPSIWFIHQFRTLILITCQILAAYFLSN